MFAAPGYQKWLIHSSRRWQQALSEGLVDQDRQTADQIELRDRESWQISSRSRRGGQMAAVSECRCRYHDRAHQHIGEYLRARFEPLLMSELKIWKDRLSLQPEIASE